MSAQAVPDYTEAMEKLVSVLDTQERLNDAVARALQSLALSADMYEARLAVISRRLDALEAGQHSIHAIGENT